MSLVAAAILILSATAGAVSIPDIQGIAFQSPYAGLIVHDVTGVVSAKVIPDAFSFLLS